MSNRYFGASPSSRPTDLVRQQFTNFTLGQTSIPVSYVPGHVDIFLSGVKLVAGLDFLGVNGTSIELLGGLELTPDDIVEIVQLGSYSPNNNALINPIKFVDGAGSPDALSAVCGLLAHTEAYLLVVKLNTTPNVTATPTFQPDGLSALPIVRANGIPLQIGDLPGVNGQAFLRYSPISGGVYILMNPYFAPITFVPASVQGAFRNLKGSATGTNAVVTYTIDEIVTGDNAGRYLATRNWNSTITMTSAGAGGLDTGAVAASTWYYAFAITKDDGTKALIASLSSTLPTLPIGYTKWARIGSIRTDGSANKYPLSFIQLNSNCEYVIAAGSNVTVLPQAASGSTGQVNTLVSLSSLVPPVAMIARCSAYFASDATASVSIAPSLSYGIGSYGYIAGPSFAGYLTTNLIVDVLLQSMNVAWSSNTATAKLQVVGWVEKF